jgi:hypothetical protein
MTPQSINEQATFISDVLTGFNNLFEGKIWTRDEISFVSEKIASDPLGNLNDIIKTAFTNPINRKHTPVILSYDEKNCSSDLNGNKYTTNLNGNDNIENQLYSYLKTMGLTQIKERYPLITDYTYNHGLRYQDVVGLKDKRSFSSQYCSRIDDINQKEKICVLPLFKMIYSTSNDLTLDEVTDIITKIISTFNLDSSKFLIKTTKMSDKLVNKLKLKCKIEKVNFIKKTNALINCDGDGYIYKNVYDNKSPILRAASLYYDLGDNNMIEIIQLQHADDETDNSYGFGVGIERLFTAINYNNENVDKPNWDKTLPNFESYCKKEAKILGVQLPGGYNLIMNEKPEAL